MGILSIFIYLNKKYICPWKCNIFYFINSNFYHCWSKFSYCIECRRRWWSRRRVQLERKAWDGNQVMMIMCQCLPSHDQCWKSWCVGWGVSNNAPDAGGGGQVPGWIESTQNSMENAILAAFVDISLAIQPQFLSASPTSIPSTATTPKLNWAPSQPLQPNISNLLPSQNPPGKLQTTLG